MDEVKTEIKTDKYFPDCLAKGVVLYYPTVNGAETKPVSKDSTLDNFTANYYWLGRLLPNEDRVPKFMEYPGDGVSDIPRDCFFRIKVIVMVNRSFKISQDGMRLVNTEEYTRLHERFAKTDLTSSFWKWLSICHESFDS
eukprot:TRINITY_DN3379_c0_g1_i2.p1 TRINITY_DN3379_c0_g1~~TRINITY_DN3379_c0_g1_i2.p1  ORF type:complete len:140 (+),score=24.00 TRINITY_DN3379_c0_g1_i2:572-991(+)